MSYLENERVGRVARRLGFGIASGITAAVPCVDDAVLIALDLLAATPEPSDFVVPKDPDDARTPAERNAPYKYWITQMIDGQRRIEECLTWFWRDHFAMSMAKVEFRTRCMCGI